MHLFVIILVFLGVLALVALLVVPSPVTQQQTDAAKAFYGLNVAHRGLYKKDQSVPENSLPAFKAAAAATYGIELDIQLSKDGHVVVFHDDDVKRACGREGRVDSYTLAELREMRLFGTEETIPEFSEMLNAVGGASPLIIELKTGPRNRELCEAMWAQLHRYNGVYCVESFDPRILRWFKKNHPEVLRGQLSAPPRHLGSGIVGIAVGFLLTNRIAAPHFIAYRIGRIPALARFARRLAIRVAWTASSEAELEAAQRDNDTVIFEYYSPMPRYKQPTL